MGATVTAKCSCGFQEVNMPIGGGFRNFHYFCGFPVLCRQCQNLSIANLLAGIPYEPITGELEGPGKRREPMEEAPECRSCGSRDVVAYDSEELIKERGAVVQSWNVKGKIGRVLELTDGRYYCPKCKRYDMSFEAGTLHWD